MALACLLCCRAVCAAEVLCRTDGERLEGQVSYADGVWTAGRQRVPAPAVLWVRLDDGAPPERLAAGVFLRGDSLLAGTLDSLVGEEAALTAVALGGPLRLARDELAGAFFPLPEGRNENHPLLARYALVLAALDPAANEAAPVAEELRLKPGRRERVTYANLDALNGRLLRLGAEKAVIELPGGELAAPKREAVRVVELKAPAPAPATPDEQRLGPEWVVRLKSGDVLRGRLVKLDAQDLQLHTSWGGLRKLPRGLLAAIHPAGRPEDALTWLSALRPKRSEHTPFFDAHFPLRLNLSCGGRLIRLSGLVCDRGLGVHAKSDLLYMVEGGPGRRLVTWVGVDDETQGRGKAQAKVLVNGKEVWSSGLLTGGVPPRFVSVDLAQARELRLLVEFGGDDDSGDHVSWGWAAIVKR